MIAQPTIDKVIAVYFSSKEIILLIKTRKKV